MRADIERLRFRMTAQVERHRRRARLTAQQKRHRGRTWSRTFERFGNGFPQSRRAVLFEQFRQARGFVRRRLSVRKGLIEERFALRHELLQPARGCRVKRFALAFEHGVLMRGIKHELTAIVGARVTRNLVGAIQNAHECIGGGQSQLPPHGFGRDGILIQIEADIDGFC